MQYTINLFLVLEINAFTHSHQNIGKNAVFVPTTDLQSYRVIATSIGFLSFVSPKTGNCIRIYNLIYLLEKPECALFIEPIQS